MTISEQKKAASEFVRKWEGRGDEKQDCQKFWMELLHNVFDVVNPSDVVDFEKSVKLDGSTRYIDVYIPSTKVIIEQKGISVNLSKKEAQSGGDFMTPYEQARRYDNNLIHNEKAKWIICCNFASFEIHDMDRPLAEPDVVLLKDLPSELGRLAFLVNPDKTRTEKEKQLSIEAGALVGRLYDLLLAQYRDPHSEKTLQALNKLCVRIVFCLYAEDSGLFGKTDAFHDLLASYNRDNVRDGLIKLFRVLDTPQDKRDPYLEEKFSVLPYVNGGLFKGEIEIPRLTDDILSLLLDGMSLGFDWSDISPTIFGAVFESTLNPETRRGGGMHYTSVENIHKVIDPLFLNGLRNELDELLEIQDIKRRKKALLGFQDKIAGLKFFDPACGSGNFLTETYISLRHLENKLLRAVYKYENFFGGEASPLKVSVNQFYGIEINDFAVSVAMTALWIAEAQALRETEDFIGQDLPFFPLQTLEGLHEGNALTLDWASVVPPSELDYIMGNPPFVGYSLQTKEQKAEMQDVFVDAKGKPYKTSGKIDYVAAWYYKAAQMMHAAACHSSEQTAHSIRTALVSTNSITQGEQVAAVWKPLKDLFNVRIDFAYRTFRWDSEASVKAHVHVVIIGFSCGAPTGQNVQCHSEQSEESAGQYVHCHSERSEESVKADKIETSDSSSTSSPQNDRAAIPLQNDKGTIPLRNDREASRSCVIYDGGRAIPARHINPYLIDAPDIFVYSRSKPLCDVPEMTTGNRPADGGNLIIEAADYENFVRKEPDAKPFIKKLLGSDEFINNKKRWCLWLVDASPAQLRRMPLVMERIRKCKEDRLASPDAGRRKLADRPAIFRETNNPKNYIIVPATSSEKRLYIPMGFLDDNTIPTNSVIIIPSATLYHFGVLESFVHMAWMRAVCGRLKSDYRYSKDIVYNNFPWPARCASDSSVATLPRNDKGAIPLRNDSGTIPLRNDKGATFPQNDNKVDTNTFRCHSERSEESVALRGHIMTEAERQRIEETAQAILDARAKYPDSSLADLYDPVTMPYDLLEAHRANDRAVAAAYGFTEDPTDPNAEPIIVSRLLTLYSRMLSS